MILRTSTSHEEGVNRQWSVMTRAFLGDGGVVEALETMNVKQNGNEITPLPGTRRTWSANLVLLAIGYTGPESDRFTNELDVALDERNNFQTDSNYQTNVPGVFAAGDARRGQSLVVWAISEGREAARHADAYLSGFIALPTKGEGDLPRK